MTAQIQAPTTAAPPLVLAPLRGRALAGWAALGGTGLAQPLTSQLTIRLASWHEGEEAASFRPPC